MTESPDPSPPAREEPVAPTATSETTELLDRLLRLSPEQRIEIAEALFDSVEGDDDEFELSPEQRAELERRLRTPGRFRPVEEFLADLDARYA